MFFQLELELEVVLIRLWQTLQRSRDHRAEKGSQHRNKNECQDSLSLRSGACSGPIGGEKATSKPLQKSLARRGLRCLQARARSEQGIPGVQELSPAACVRGVMAGMQRWRPSDDASVLHIIMCKFHPKAKLVILN